MRTRRVIPDDPEISAALENDFLDIADKEEELFKIQQLRRQKFAANGAHVASDGLATPLSGKLRLKSFDLKGIAQYVKDYGVQRVVVMCGAGISTSAGIPDFRSPGTGLYHNLQRFNLPKAESIFELSYFRRKPAAFYELAKEMWPGRFNPTPCHFFIRLLHEKGILLRCYSQNIDSLEKEAGLPADRLVAAHGNFDEAHVIGTHPQKKVDIDEVREAISQGEPGWRSLNERYGGLVKPNIVFFGESLPARFTAMCNDDLKTCDLLIVMGTSLEVAPFNQLVSMASRSAPRLLVNRDRVGTREELRGGFRFHLADEQNRRDVFYEGTCDAGARDLAAALGWKAELDSLIAKQGESHVSRARLSRRAALHALRVTRRGVLRQEWRRGATARFARARTHMAEKARRVRLRPVAVSQSRLIWLKRCAARLQVSKQQQSGMPSSPFISDVGKHIMQKCGWMEGQSLGTSPHIPPRSLIGISAPPPTPFLLPAAAA